MCIAAYHLTVVSVERQIFFGIVKKIQVMGNEGEMGIFPGHVPLLTCIKPGILKFLKEYGDLEYVYLSGGILEVQRDVVTILADTAIRAQELDEKQTKIAKIQFEQQLRHLRRDSKDYMKITLEMSKIIAKLKLLELMKK